MFFTGHTELLLIHQLTFFLPISDRVASFCYNLSRGETSSLTLNVSSLKDEIKLLVSHFTVAEACERSWYSSRSLSIFFCSISIRCRKGSIEGML